MKTNAFLQWKRAQKLKNDLFSRIKQRKKQVAHICLEGFKERKFESVALQLRSSRQ